MTITMTLKGTKSKRSFDINDSNEVRFDREYPYGDKADAFKNMAAEVAKAGPRRGDVRFHTPTASSRTTPASKISQLSAKF